MSRRPFAIKPKPGFDWKLVAWGKSDSRPSELCSYCFNAIPDDVVPLILWRDDGSSCRFCDACMQRWWGFEPHPDRAG